MKLFIFLLLFIALAISVANCQTYAEEDGIEEIKAEVENLKYLTLRQNEMEKELAVLRAKVARQDILEYEIEALKRAIDSQNGLKTELDSQKKVVKQQSELISSLKKECKYLMKTIENLKSKNRIDKELKHQSHSELDTNTVETMDKPNEQPREKLMLKSEMKPSNFSKRRSRRLLIGSGETHQKPAFTATLSNHVMGLGSQQSIIFENVVTNIGNAYSNMTGAFTAPMDGTYYFSATVMSHSNQYLESEIVWNGNAIVYLYSFDTHYEQGSGGIVLSLKQGDTVWVRHHASEGDNVHGSNWSFFSGFLI